MIAETTSACGAGIQWDCMSLKLFMFFNPRQRL